MTRTGVAVGVVFVAVLVAGALALNRVDGTDGTREDVAQPVVSGDAVDPQPDGRQTAVHMRLQDDLDRPEDGWCLDVVGSGPHIRFDMPLIAHNIKPGLYADEAVEFTAEGQIRFPAYPGYCVTVMGLNEFALPGAALMLKKCGEDIPFLNASKFQTFELLDDGMVQLKGTDLCITVGDESQRTFDPTHRWRTLYVERRADCDPSRSRWAFVRP
ncbi:MAG: RICIN domain-containing protein [Planctomycetota bacterium]